MSQNFKRFTSIFSSSALLALSLTALAINPASASASLSIPCSVDGEVVAVDNEINYETNNYSCVGEVTIPEGVSKFGYGAFLGNSDITKIRIPSTVTTIETFAFAYNEELSAIEVDPNNPSFSSVGGVLYNKNQSELIFRPSNILNELFVVPNTVRKMREYAITASPNLRTIEIGDSVTEIEISTEDAVFVENYALQSIIVSPGNPNYASEDGVLFNKNKTELLQYPTGSALNSYEIPGTVTKIKNHAFMRITSLESVTIPDSVTTIGENAFYGATVLASISIGQNVKSIGGFAFAYMPSIADITIPNSVESIGVGIFQGDTNMLSVTLSSALTAIPDQAFSLNRSLTSISIPAGVTFIGTEAFYDNRAITSISIPAGVTFIGQSAFRDMRSLSNVSFAGSFAPVVGHYAFLNAASGATVTFADGAVGFCGSETWNNLVLPEGGSPCPPNCSAITGGNVTATNDGWTLSWDALSYKNRVDSLDIFVISGEEERDWYDNLAGLFISGATSAASTSYKVPKAVMETLSRDKDLTSFTFKIKKVNSADGCYPLTELGNITVAKSPTELARLAEVARIAAVVQSRQEIVTLLKSASPLTVAILKSAGFPGATDKNIGRINKEISELSSEQQKDLAQIMKIVRKYEVLDILAKPQPISKQTNLLIEIGLIPATSKNKTILTSALRSLDPADRADLEKVKATIDAKAREIQERAARMAEIHERVSAHSRG